MIDPNSPYAQHDVAFKDLLVRHNYFTNSRGVKFQALFRKRYPDTVIWLCWSKSTSLEHRETVGAADTPLEALIDLCEELGVIPLTMPEEKAVVS